MKRSAVVLALAAAASSPAHANPVDLFGFGARATAMGGAQTAATDDGSANYYNPGALARGDQVRLDLGYQYARPSLRMNGGDQNVPSSRGLAVALAVPMFVRGRHVVTVGTGLFLPDQQLLQIRTLPAQQPRWARYDHGPQRFFFGAHAAARLPGELQLGVGVGIMAEPSGSFHMSGRLGFPDSFDSELGLAVDLDVTPALYPQLGLRWQPEPWLDVGLAYRGEFVVDSYQLIVFEADIGPGGAAPIVDDALIRIDARALDLFQPAQVAAGCAIRATPRITVAADAVYARWSRFRNPTPVIELELDVGQFNDFVDLGEAPRLEDPHFHDTLSLKTGVELLVADGRHAAWRVRAGYSWEPTPAPEQVGESNFVDNDRHGLATGLGVRVSGLSQILPHPFDVDTYVAYTALPARSHRKLSAVDAVGDYVARGSIWAAGITTGVRF
ncbi:MAG TPA: outer membrane protein transport protein [Kofleriaceae bacterium]|nr:outer membrane protein transport protein [Kofleriaceae bacterium]